MSEAREPEIHIHLHKDSPSASDVHVDAPIGSTRRGRKPVRQPSFDQNTVDPEGDDGPDGDILMARKFIKISGVDEELGLAFGWGIISTQNGKPYVDEQDDHIPEAAMVKAATDFMKSSRMAGEMHARMGAGAVVHSFPLTADIAKACGIETTRTGWLVGVAPDPEMLAKFKSGELAGFSIGGFVHGDN